MNTLLEGNLMSHTDCSQFDENIELEHKTGDECPQYGIEHR